ncbi:MAG: ParB-like nuclease domain-containing protein [Oscillospiraceae bacterium]|nr:ParB-like nuclease domain-containing protein [Oscillospiraceae bacterium]
MEDNKPTMGWIDIDLLQIDTDYQRDSTGTRSKILIEKIYKNFNWRDFTPITVVKTETGFYNILDGQHRFLAAKKRKIKELPCWIVGENNTEDEAKTFLNINRNRVAVNAYAIYKAKIAAKDETAIKIQDYCNNAGVVIPFNGYCSKPNMTLAITFISECLHKHNQAYLTEAIKCIVAAYPKKNGQLKRDILYTIVKLKIEMGKKVNNDLIINALKEYQNVDAITGKARELAALDTSLKLQNAHYKVFFNKIKEIKKRMGGVEEND